MDEARGRLPAARLDPLELRVPVMLSALALLAVAAVDLTWIAPEDDCPSQPEVLDRIRASLSPQGDVEITARVDVLEGRWRLRLKTRAGGMIGSRELVAADCAVLADAAVLLATMAARPSPDPSVEPAQAPEDELEASSEPPSAEGGTAEPASRGPWALGLGVRWDGGRLPADLPGLQLDGAWSRGPWSVGARAFGWLPSAGGAFAEGTRATFFGLGLGALGCAGISWVVRPEACLAVDLWALRGSATGVADPAQPWAPLVSVAARLQATWPADGAWALRLAGELGVELNPARFRVEPLGEVHRVERWLPSGSASLIFRP